ncbi:MAG: TA system VapC family ribonuclease toxin [Verrucomicrobiota bacterium]
MIIPDVNLWIYAHRQEDPAHSFYRNWIEIILNGDEPVGLSSLTATAFVRIVTHPNFPPLPTPLRQAIGVIDDLKNFYNCRWLLPGQDHWQITKMLCEKTTSIGKHVADAQHAAIAIEYHATFVTRDRDFLKFKPHGLHVEILEPPYSTP